MTPAILCPKLLLLAGSSPAEQHGGEVWLEDLCRAYPRDRLCRFSVVHAGIPKPAEWPAAEVEYVPFPREYGVLRYGRTVAKISSMPLPAWNRMIVFRALRDKAVALGTRNSVDVVWAILDSGTLMWLAHTVSRRLRVPLLVSVLDPPERWVSDLHLGRAASRAMLDDFERSLRTAVRCSVISEAMAEEYARRYGIEGVVLRHGLPARLHRPPRPAVAGDRLTIAFAGTLYERDDLRALASALEGVDWKLGSRSVTLRIIGRPFVDLGVNPDRLEFHGWRTAAETIELMSRADVSYLPYWMAPQHEMAARLCFPTKLAAYLAAGTPVLFHGPRYSSPVQFLKRYPAGVVCDSTDPADLLASLATLVEPKTYSAAASAAQRAVEEELNLEVFLDRFARLIGIPRTALRG